MIYSSILLASLAALVASTPLDKRAASCGNEGVEYAVFDLSDKKIPNNGKGYSNFAPIFPELQTTRVPKYTGVTKKLKYVVNKGTDMVYDKQIEDSGWFAVEHRFWLCAPVAGEYCFKTVGRQDDNTWAWIGNSAFSEYKYDKVKVNDGWYGPLTTEHKCKLQAGQEIPIRIITAECDAPATFGFQIAGPSGVLIGPDTECTTNIKRWICGKESTTKYPPYKKEEPIGPQNTCSNGGVNYAIFALQGADRIQNANKGYTNIKPLLPKLEGMAPQATGVTKILGYDSGPASKDKKLYQSEWNEWNWFAVEHRFYIITDECGEYSFKTSGLQDDATFAWIGEKAYSGYNYDNANINDGYYGATKPKEYKLKCKRGEKIPIRIITLECAVPAVFDFTVTSPKGKVLIGPKAEASPHVVQWFCTDAKTKFPPYKPVAPIKPPTPVTPVKPVVKPPTSGGYGEEGGYGNGGY